MLRNKDTIIFFSIALFLLILFGCNSTQEGTLSSRKSGELGLKIKWGTNGFDETTNQADSFDCISSGVKDIEIIVYDQSGNELTSSDYGIVTNIRERSKASQKAPSTFYCRAEMKMAKFSIAE